MSRGSAHHETKFWNLAVHHHLGRADPAQEKYTTNSALLQQLPILYYWMKNCLSALYYLYLKLAWADVAIH